MVRKNQQANHHCEIDSIVPRMTRSRLNHIIYLLVKVFLWCRNIKPKYYRVISTSFKTVNKFLVWNRIFDAVFCVFFSCWFFMRKHYFSTKPSKTQHTHWIWIEVKHLIVYPNQQVDRHCEINSLVYKTPCLGINHTLYWLVTVLVWYRTVKPEDCEVRSDSFTAVKNLSRQN